MRNDREKKGLEFRKHGFGGESLRPAGRWTKKMGLVILGLVLGCSMQALAQSENTLFIWNEENCTLEDGLCTDWRVSRDGKRITFQVPEGQRWPDGKVMTAEAVRSRIETTLQESPFAGGLGVIDDMEVSGREVRLTLLHYSRELELYFSSSLFVRGDLEEEGFPAIVYLELNEDSENLKDRKVGEELVQLLDREALAEAAVSATMVAENEMEEPLESKNAEAKNTESKNVASENAIAEKAELEEGRERNLERDWRPAYSLISPGMMYYDSAEEEKLRAQLDRTWEKKKKEEKEKKEEKNKEESNREEGNQEEGKHEETSNQEQEAVMEEKPFLTLLCPEELEAVGRSLTQQWESGGFSIDLQVEKQSEILEKVESDRYEIALEVMAWPEPTLLLECAASDPTAPGREEAFIQLIEECRQELGQKAVKKKLVEAQAYLIGEMELVPLLSMPDEF